MGAVDELKQSIGNVWLGELIKEIAYELSHCEGDAFKTVNVNTQDFKGQAPVVDSLTNKFEILKKLGYINKLQLDQCNDPELVFDSRYAFGVPYLNGKAKKMYEKLKAEGYYSKSSSLEEVVEPNSE